MAAQKNKPWQFTNKKWIFSCVFSQTSSLFVNEFFFLYLEFWLFTCLTVGETTTPGTAQFIALLVSASSGLLHISISRSLSLSLSFPHHTYTNSRTHFTEKLSQKLTNLSSNSLVHIYTHIWSLSLSQPLYLSWTLPFNIHILTLLTHLYIYIHIQSCTETHTHIFAYK